MTIFNPVYRVKVNGSTVTTATLSGLTVTSGRTSIYSQPIAGYCNLSLLETNAADVNYDINDAVTVEVKNTAGNYIYLFGGFITDLNITVQNSGSTALSQKINIIAVGALARLSRTIFTGNLPFEFDGDRISYLLGLVLFDAWNEVPASLTWNTYDPTTTWANAQNSGYGEIDTPGDYELHSQTNLNDTIYNIASITANSGLGYLYEDAQGRIGYADSTHRNSYLATYGYIDLDGNHAIGPGLQISKRAGDVRNAVTVSYGANGESSVSTSDATSIANYGELANTIETVLRKQADAEAQASYYLSIRANPQYEMRQIVFPITSPEIDNSNRDSLLNVFMGLPLNITNLPANMVDGAFQGFVEGWTWSASLNSLILTLNVSPLAYSLQAMRWNSVPATETWQTISPTLDWLNATIIA
ncbi:MAG: hypothetical protein EBX40_05245 [Gammaproteobacteria bacterium]|nr:hypothetical protein [Gammaproteobacteria bacterium]